MAGPLSSERPADGAHLTHHSSTWGEIQKDAIGVYRGKSKTRDEGYGKSSVSVSAGAVSHGAMGQPPALSAGTAKFKRKRK